MPAHKGEVKVEVKAADASSEERAPRGGRGATKIRSECTEDQVAIPTPDLALSTAAPAGAAVATRRQSDAQPQIEDTYLVALAKRGSADAYERIVKRYRGFVRLKASSYFLLGGESEDLIQRGSSASTRRFATTAPTASRA